jgi:hypothetical protein
MQAHRLANVMQCTELHRLHHAPIYAHLNRRKQV